MRSQKKKLLFLIGIGLTVRVVFLIFAMEKGEETFYLPPPVKSKFFPSERQYFLRGGGPGDSQQYETLALNLLHYRVFSWDSYPHFRPNSFRTPGYPFFIALVYALLGTHPLYLILLQIFLSLLIVWITFTLGEKLWNHRVGFLAGVLFALDPVSIFNCLHIMADTLFTLLLLLSFYLLLWRFPLLSSSRSLSSGLLLGIGAMVKPIGLYIPFLSLPLILLLKGIRFSRRVVLCLFLLLGFSLPTFFWTYRNYRYFHKAIFTTLPGFNILLCNASTLIAHKGNISLREAQNLLLKQTLPLVEHKNLNTPEISSIYKKEGMRIILQHPWEYLYLHLLGGISVLLGTKMDNLFQLIDPSLPSLNFFPKLLKGKAGELIRKVFREGRVVFIGISLSLLLMILCYLFTFYYLFRFPFNPITLLGILLIFYFYIIAGPVADSRFRLPFLPYLYLMSAAGLLKVRAKNTREEFLHP